jgi:hypothetical protein
MVNECQLVSFDVVVIWRAFGNQLIVRCLDMIWTERLCGVSMVVLVDSKVFFSFIFLYLLLFDFLESTLTLNTDLRSAVVGKDGTFYVNDAVGSMYALQIVNGSLPTGTPSPPPSPTVTPHELTTTLPSGSSSPPFDGAWLLAFIVVVSLATFGIATLIAMFLLRQRRAGYKKI